MTSRSPAIETPAPSIGGEPGASTETGGAAARVVAPQLAGVVGEEAAARFIAFADHLPPRLTTYVGAEVRLDQPTGADFLAYVDSPQALRDVPVELVPRAGDVERLAAALATPPPGLSQPLEHGWIEWDLAGASRDDPSVHHPSIFAAPPSDEALGRSAASVFAALGGDPSAAMDAAIAHLDRVLRPPSVVMQVGAMAPPRPAGCRIVVAGGPPRQLVDMVVAAGWPGPTALVAHHASLAEQLELAMAVDLDLSATGFEPSIGFEFVVGTSDDHHRLLELAVGEGWCDDVVAASLAPWRVVAGPDGSSRFPARLQRTQDLLGPRVRVAVLGWLHHIKLAVAADGSQRAKAYLGIREHVAVPKAAT